MSDQYNTCAICGKQYKQCRVCEINRGTWASWKQFTDCHEHFQIFTILRTYNNNKLTKAEAAEELKKCDLSDKASLLPRIQELIDEILKEDNTEKNSVTEQRSIDSSESQNIYSTKDAISTTASHASSKRKKQWRR